MAKVVRVIVYEGEESSINCCLGQSLPDGIKQMPHYSITVATVEDDRQIKEEAGEYIKAAKERGLL